MGISSVRRIVGNAIFILMSDVVNRASTFVLYALVARYLGAFEFGQMSLALMLFYTFQVFATAGLKTLVTREVAKDQTETDKYLVNGSVVVVVSSLLSITTLLLFVRLINYSRDTASIILLLSLGLLPYSLSVICEAVFQAWERMHYIAYVNVSVNIAKVSLAFLILSRGYSLYHLIILLLASYVAIGGIEWWLIFRHIIKPRLQIDPNFSLAMIKSASTFLGIDGLIAIRASLDIILLSKLATETEVGLYTAAAQLIVPVMLIYQSVVSSIFPAMCRRFEPGFQSLKRITEDLIELLLAIALPTVIGLFLLADLMFLLLYGNKDFLLASDPLRIMIWDLIFIALTHGLGQVLLVGLREKVTLRIVAINALVNLVFGLILIGQFSLIGAAIAVLLTGIINFFQHYVPVSKLLSKITLGRLVWKPVVASTCMAIYLVAVQSQGVLLSVIFAAVLYTTVLLALAIWSSGGPRQLRARYLYLLSE
jgi:O-antigen/teichoic acid export membrane protein